MKTLSQKFVRTLAQVSVLGVFAAFTLAAPPRIATATPDHGDTGVDPALKEIRIEFDQDMSTRGQSVCGGGPKFPKITGRPKWESPRVMIIPVELVPGHDYELSINCPAATNFRNAAGEIAEITPIQFQTAKAGETPRPTVELTREDNERAIELLKKAVDDRYSYRDRVVKDWNALFDDLRLECIASTTRAGFARALGRSLAGANDPHLGLRVGSAYFGTVRSWPEPNADIRRLEKLVPGFKRDGLIATGRFEDGVGYLAIFSWPSDGAALDAAVAVLKGWADAPGIVIDVRLNGGGDEVVARRVASLFVKERTIYSRNRFRDPTQPEGWGKMLVRSITSAEDATPCSGKVAVLMGPVCMSSNESFILMMKHGGGATLVGARTRGSSGNPKPHDLGNGVTLVAPSWEDFQPDGSALEGIGIEPDIKAELGTGESSDGVLAAALEFLRAK